MNEGSVLLMNDTPLYLDGKRISIYREALSITTERD